MSLQDNYRLELTALLERTAPDPGGGPKIEFKRNFGAIAATTEGRIFCSYGKFGLALRLPARTRTELMENQGGAPLRYFPKGHIKKEYVIIPDEIVTSSDRLGRLVRESLQFVLSKEL